MPVLPPPRHFCLSSLIITISPVTLLRRDFGFPSINVARNGGPRFLKEPFPMARVPAIVMADSNIDIAMSSSICLVHELT